MCVALLENFFFYIFYGVVKKNGVSTLSLSQGKVKLMVCATFKKKKFVVVVVVVACLFDFFFL